MASIIIFLLMLAVLLLPGWTGYCCYTLLKSHRLYESGDLDKRQQNLPHSTLYQSLYSLAFSYGFFAIVVSLSRAFQLSYSQFSTVIGTYLVLAIILVTVLKARKLNRFVQKKHTSYLAHIAIALIVLVFSVYHLMVGAYTEIPADIYFHVEKIRQIYSDFSINELAPISSVSHAIKNDVEVWYYLLAWLMHSSGASIAEMLQTVTWVSQSLFLYAVYCLSLRIFRKRQGVIIVASVATILVAIHFGVNVFSYLRYYALAPAMLALIIYFSAILIFWDLLLKKRFNSALFKSIFWCFLLVSALLIHTQEAMFIAIHTSIMLCIYAFSLLRRSTDLHQQESGFITYQSNRYFDAVVKCLALAVVAVFVTAYIISHYTFVHFGNLGDRLLELGPSIGLLPQLSILNPSFQFIQVVTLWGLLIYVLFFIHWPRYKHNLFLVSGMLMPAFTVFNPFFTDLFLRFTDSTVLWRFCFLIPIYYVAADLVVLYLQRCCSWNFLHRFIQSFSQNSSQKPINISVTVSQKVTASLALISLFVLLLPFKNGWHNMHYSRYPTLRPVTEQQSYQHLEDVIVFLNQTSKRKELLTDPVTGYVLSGFTSHISYRDKFFITPNSEFKRFYFADYTERPLKQYAGKLLVINRRTVNNGNSFVGAVSKHWHTDLFNRMALFYPDSLIEHLDNHREDFDLIFEQDNIFVYKIR